MEDPLAVPRPRSGPVAASPGHRPVSARSWAGRWLPASRSPSSDRTQRSGPAAVSGAAPLVSKMHSHMRTCSWWAILTARITVQAASHSRRPAQAIRSRAPARNARSARAPVGRPMSGSGGSGESAWALGLPMRIRFITDLPWVINRARPGILLLIPRSLRIRQGNAGLPRGILAVIKSFATRVCAGQGSDDPFSHGRSAGRPAEAAGGAALAVARCDHHPRGTQETHRMAPADGAGRRRGKVPGQIGRIAPVACLGVSVPGAAVVAAAARPGAGWPGAGNTGAGAWPG